MCNLLPYDGCWQPIFMHGDHITRIDFIFARRNQRRATMNSHIINDFDRNFGITGPHHRPLSLCIAKWHPVKLPKIAPDSINRFQFGYACETNIPQWQLFRQAACDLIHSHHKNI